MAPRRSFPVGGVEVGEGAPLLVIAGPCVLEDPDEMLRTAERLAASWRGLGWNSKFRL